MNVKLKILSNLIFSLLALSLIAMALFRSLGTKLPLINGIVIPEAKSIAEFSIVDHNNRQFSNKELLGKWHFISYGYTHCPDICPTTLSVLNQLVTRLSTDHQYSDLNVIFYSIDHERDTVENLQKYIPFFNKKFIGLTYRNGMQDSAMAFENSLGIRAILTPTKEPRDREIYGEYRVSHGAMLYLINPAGKLQAVLKPIRSKEGRLYFSVNQLFKDYLAVRAYFR